MYRDPTDSPNFEFYDSDDKEKRKKQAIKDFKKSEKGTSNKGKYYIEKDDHLKHPQIHGPASQIN